MSLSKETLQTYVGRRVTLADDTHEYTGTVRHADEHNEQGLVVPGTNEPDADVWVKLDTGEQISNQSPGFRISALD